MVTSELEAVLDSNTKTYSVRAVKYLVIEASREVSPEERAMCKVSSCGHLCSRPVMRYSAILLLQEGYIWRYMSNLQDHAYSEVSTMASSWQPSEGVPCKIDN